MALGASRLWRHWPVAQHSRHWVGDTRHEGFALGGAYRQVVA